MLGLDTHETAEAIAHEITGILFEYEFYIKRRKYAKSDRDRKERLRELAAAARKLSRILDAEPFPYTIMRLPDSCKPKNETGASCSNLATIEAASAWPQRLKDGLIMIAERADRIAKDDAEFARCHMLLPDPKLRRRKVAPVSRFVWPELFELWTSAGKTLSWTENGPTHRFIALVHRAAGLSEPAQSTLRDAIEEWKKSIANEG